ncbi:MAG: four helix bundle protein [Phycisphaerae bacterium]
MEGFLDFIPKLYKVTESFPESGKYGLLSQLRRATVSVSSNIAEGAGRGSNADFARFLDIAIGSTFEVECQLLVAKELGLAEAEEIDELLVELDSVKKLIYGFAKALRHPKT